MFRYEKFVSGTFCFSVLMFVHLNVLFKLYI